MQISGEVSARVGDGNDRVDEDDEGWLE